MTAEQSMRCKTIRVEASSQHLHHLRQRRICGERNILRLHLAAVFNVETAMMFAINVMHKGQTMCRYRR